MKSFWKFILLAAGLALFGWYISRIGLETVWRAILSLGYWAPLVMLPYFVVYIIDCLAWSRTLPRPVPFLTLLRIRWAGESLNNLVPSAYVGGETLKVMLLRSHGISAAEGAASAVVSKTAQTVAQIVFILAASLIFLSLAREQPALRTMLLVVCVLGIATVAALFWVQNLGLFRLVTSVLEFVRFRSAALESRKAKLRDLDSTIFSFYRTQPGKFYSSTFLYLCGWTLDTVEIYLVSHLLGMPISWSQAIAMEAFTGVAKALGMWLPGSLGIQESGIVLLGRLAGLPPPLAAAYAIIRRVRELIFAGIGMLLLYAAPRKVELVRSSAAAPRF